MTTKQVYYESPYLKELEAKIVSLEQRPNLANIILDQTIFYPEGGGQPSDTGSIKGRDGEAKVEYVRIIEGKITHQAKISGLLNTGDEVNLSIDWNSRLKYMRVHTAGHLLHDVLMTIGSNLVPVKGGHGNKPFIEYKGEFDIVKRQELENKVNEYLLKDLPVSTKEVSYKELMAECKFVPENLPKDKPLRAIKIDEFDMMPDGGVHIKSTKEIGKIWIANITVENGLTNVRYGISDVTKS